MRTGIDRQTGKIITGWAHCVQSIVVILTTMIGARVMIRAFGSNVPGLIDRPGNAQTTMMVFVAIAEALRRWEPGFKLTKVQLTRLDADGNASFDIAGDFYPNGHLGDFSIVEKRVSAVTLANDNAQTVRAA